MFVDCEICGDAGDGHRDASRRFALDLQRIADALRHPVHRKRARDCTALADSVRWQRIWADDEEEEAVEEPKEAEGAQVGRLVAVETSVTAVVAGCPDGSKQTQHCISVCPATACDVR